jgi:diaminohydroxyphosphoribosylaminopyrimidine deaminase/5-amino-6-(5-phosphoribosylamino)uracil reductase
VGAVIVKGRTVVGAGATQQWGGPHGEIMALRQAGARAKGASLYVTLEPCNHFGKTPPCTRAVVAAGIAEVFVAVKDPNPLVAGKGIRYLRSHGVKVQVGLLEAQARRLNEDFFWAITSKTAWISLKLALTLDGRITDAFGKSRWITNQASRTLVHDLRRRHAGIAVGSATVAADNPQLTVRHVKGVSPARFVFTSRTGLPPDCHLAKTTGGLRTILVMPGGRARTKSIGADGIQTWHTGAGPHTRAHLEAFLAMAYEERLTSILIEGGQQLASAFLEHRLVNRVYLFYGNRLLGGGLDGLRFGKSLSLSRCMHLDQLAITTLEDNVMITGLPVWED